MPADPVNGQEASSLLPLRTLGEGQVDDDDSDLDLFADEEYAHSFDAINHKSPSRPQRIIWALVSWLPFKSLRRQRLPGASVAENSSTKPRKRRLFVWLGIILVCWCSLIIVFFPSYTRPPQHYNDLQKRAFASDEPGRANVNNEKIFIAASVYDNDGALLSGDWGKAVAGLVQLLGPQNVFLSIYENDASAKAAEALTAFAKRITCESKIVNEHLDTADLQRVIMPDGKRLLKRIAFLAKVRNQALAPLDGNPSAMQNAKFDKILYVNDVVFNPIDAANLLFSTNQGSDGKTNYRAACATDFINPFKFYDTFATRDLEGHNMGVPFYPWFTSAGRGDSRKDVQRQTDAVRVRSCWGGMVAFKASYFQDATTRSVEDTSLLRRSADIGFLERADETSPLRFRAEEDPFWDASECCLIHADLQHIDAVDLSSSTGIYMNPFVRVAYDSKTLSWLSVTRRFERLYSPAQSLINYLAGRPSVQPRRTEEPGEEVSDRVWISDEKSNTGSYQDVKRIAKPGGFCGDRKLLALPEDGHGGHWWNQPLPPDV
ncbi:glycosyltransferase family 69 protein [Myriangium duriaei CBS 260.36]|uniref:Glycosyltransferase family 69 protein n=1 Tax=Myriangium duriaei CBS 260.36 TaxID=1168546 RepID=A0A9P4MEW9_9PEZI|nr:glycosyltransferase family 69 protein [Myriangium duriaei CBS 260.36]